MQILVLATSINVPQSFSTPLSAPLRSGTVIPKHSFRNTEELA
jgi:hypothetical protein